MGKGEVVPHLRDASVPLPNLFTVILFLCILIILATLIAIGLRAVSAPGYAVLAGVLAGIMLGPTITGRISPGWYDTAIVGGTQERIDLIAQKEAAKQASATNGGSTPLEAQEQILKRETALEHARWQHQQPWRIATVTFAGLFCFIAACRSRRRTTHDESPGWYQPISIGLWALAAPGAAAAIVLTWLGITIEACLATAACIGTGAASITQIDAKAADDAEIGGSQLMQRAAIISTLAALAILTYAIVTEHDTARLLWMLPLLAIGIGWTIIRFSPPIIPKDPPDNSQSMSWPTKLLSLVIVPSMTALIVVRIELFVHFAFWITLILAFLAGDGRWFGAFIGARLAGTRKSLHTMRLVLAAMSAGTTQIAFVAAAFASATVDESLTFALILAALFMEMTTNARSGLSKELEETEELWERESQDY